MSARPRFKGRYRKDRSLAGTGTVKRTHTFPPIDAAMLAQLAERTQMSESAFLRQAMKHFAEKIFPGEYS